MKVFRVISGTVVMRTNNKADALNELCLCNGNEKERFFFNEEEAKAYYDSIKVSGNAAKSSYVVTTYDFFGKALEVANADDDCGDAEETFHSTDCVDGIAWEMQEEAED